VELGYSTPTLKHHLFDAIENLTTEIYSENLEQFLICAFSWQNADYRKLSQISTSLLIAKYDLKNDQAILDMDMLISDELLIELLTKSQSKSIYLESLLAELRKSILNEVAITETLREELQAITIALGIYSVENDYVMISSHEEEQEISGLITSLRQACSTSWEQNDIVGALLVLSLYEPLYSQSFSTQLLKFDLEEWPLATQALLKSNLYDLCNEHGNVLTLFGQNQTDLLSNEISRPLNRWSALKPHAKSNMYSALNRTLGEGLVPERFESSSLKILLIGCGTGERAFYLANYFDNVHVVAIDHSKENLGYAIGKAKELEIENIQFGLADLSIAFESTNEIGNKNTDKFDIIEFTESINHVLNPKQTIDSWKSLLTEDGLIRFDFNAIKAQETRGLISQLVGERRLSPTSDNIRHLRNAIIQEAKSGLWDDLFLDEYFYSGTGCKELFFQKNNHHFDLNAISNLLKQTGLNFKGFINSEVDTLKKNLNGDANDLSTWDLHNELLTGTTNSYQFYCGRS